MSTFRLRTQPPLQADQYYLDTSALTALAVVEASQKGGGGTVEKLESDRAEELREFLTKANGVGAICRTSILSIEELAAKTRNVVRNTEAAATRYQSWGNMKKVDPSAADLVDTKAHTAMLNIMKYCADVLSQFQIALAWPATGVNSAPSHMRKYHRQLLRDVPELDAMDALHIVVGLALGIKKFISYDRGWRSCANIDVYH